MHLWYEMCKQVTKRHDSMEKELQKRREREMRGKKWKKKKKRTQMRLKCSHYHILERNKCIILTTSYYVVAAAIYSMQQSATQTAEKLQFYYLSIIGGQL